MIPGFFLCDPISKDSLPFESDDVAGFAVFASI
jgi:hypothetical protein